MSLDYPLCTKYNCPVEDGLVQPEAFREWIKTLPYEWSESLGDCMGQVTCIEAGIYACDVEDTLWSLERNRKYRRWNG